MSDRASIIRRYLEDLERLVRAEGDRTSADLLQNIIQSPDPLRDLRLALSKNRKDRTPGEREKWFKAWQNGQLSKAQVNFLTSTTRNWKLEGDSIAIISAYARLWIQRPCEFWSGPPPDNDILKRCYDDLKIFREVVPTREKVASMIVAREVKKEQEKIKQQTGGRQRCRARTYSRNSFLSRALMNLCEKHWGDQSKQVWLREESLGGSKWLDLDNPALVLSLYKANSARVCKHGWDKIEMKALNAFAATLPQMSIYALLEMAFDRVTEHYQYPGTCSRDIRHQIPATAQEDEEAALLLSSSRQTLLFSPVTMRSVASPGIRRDSHSTEPAVSTTEDETREPDPKRPRIASGYMTSTREIPLASGSDESRKNGADFSVLSPRNEPESTQRTPHDRPQLNMTTGESQLLSSLQDGTSSDSRVCGSPGTNFHTRDSRSPVNQNDTVLDHTLSNVEVPPLTATIQPNQQSDEFYAPQFEHSTTNLQASRTQQAEISVPTQSLQASLNTNMPAANEVSNTNTLVDSGMAVFSGECHFDPSTFFLLVVMSE